MFSVNPKELRVNRQTLNNELISKILECGDVVELKKNCNPKALERVTEFVGLSFDEIIEKCKTDIDFRRMISMYISKNSSKQGSVDEKMILVGVALEARKVGVELRPLNNTALRPVKDSSRVLNQKEYKSIDLTKYDCLKSFDAELSGKVSGYLFAKVLIGWEQKSGKVDPGGHQDNVLHESRDFCVWAKEYGDKNKVYVCLIDTDIIECYNEMKKYETENVWVVNHQELQTRLGVS
jgi:hypothetical protein